MPPSPREFAEFNGLLRSVIERGLSLPPAIALMAGVVRDPVLRSALVGTARAVADGVSLPDAMGRFPAAFSEDYCALIRAGVDSGRLAEVFRTSHIHHSLRARIRSRMTRLLLYFMGGALIGELVLIITLLVGRHIAAFNREVTKDLGLSSPPSYVEFLASTLGAGWTLPILWPALIAMLAGGYFLIQRYSRISGLGYLLPFWGPIQKSRDLALFSCTMSLRLRAGKPMTEALTSARDSIKNRKFRRLVGQVVLRVAEGESLSTALFYSSFFPKTFSWGISLGEENGTVTRTFDTFTELYTTQMERNAAILNDVLTPLGILAIGNLALLSAIMMLTPFLQTLWWWQVGN